jgi:hypothetical protein
VPVLFESWLGTQSLSSLWQEIHAHIADHLRAYVPRGRVYHTNGKLHVQRAYQSLNEHGLFRQYLLRYQGWSTDALEVVLLFRDAADWIAELIEALRPCAIAIETFFGDEGNAVLRVIGRHELVHAILAAHTDLREHHARVFVRNPHQDRGARVRFCYELLFNPKTATWQCDSERILQHMQGGRDHERA